MDLVVLSFLVLLVFLYRWQEVLEERVGDTIGKEARAHGGNLFGGVCINLLRHPAWGRAQETYGEDPFHVGEFGSALVRGVQKHNVMATAKHYAANSIENARFKINVKMDERTLREVYLPHFRKCIEQGCATVMSAYNKVNGDYCGHNSHLLRKILKQDWNFKGFVHSDWLYGLKNTIKGITGGLDVEMPRAKYYGRRLIKTVIRGDVPEDLINDSARRIIRTTLKFTTKDDIQTYPKDLIGCMDHVMLAREVAEKSMILLKNNDNILPLNETSIKRLAIIGHLADLKNTGDHGSSNVHQDEISTPFQGIRDLVEDRIQVIHEEGSEIERAKEVAKNADVAVVIVGCTYKDEGEYVKIIKQIGGDRDKLSLNPHNVELIKSITSINKNSIVVLVGGSVIMMEEWKDLVPAIIMAFYSGMEGGTALAKILFGHINPSGKLPFTIPKSQEDLPFFDKNANEIVYGYYHGYTLMEKKGIRPAFPFGYGMSYTTYKYENLQVNVKGELITATIQLSNVGNRFGEEVVQLYVGFENSKIDRPKKLLRGFQKVGLEAGETKIISISFNKKDLAWYNPESESWEVENINHTVYVGSSSDIADLLSAELKL
jgi:beta-glucosidase